MEDLKKSFLVRGDNIVGALGDKYFSTAPLGTVLSFAGSTAPNGYLLCDGASYPTADYPHLYAVIGNTYGGDSTNFNVPNLVDKFIQGSNISGTEKEAGLPNITGSIGNSGSANDQFLSDSTSAGIKTKGALSITGYASKTSMANGSDNYNTPTGFGFDASKSNAIYGNSDTVQPPALTMVYIIKAKHTNEGQDEGVSDSVIDYVDGELDKTLQFKTTDITDVNELWRENGLYIFNTSNTTNLPTSETSMGYCLEVVRFGESESSLVVQKAYRGNPNDNCPIFERRRFNATWTDWVGIPNLSDTTTSETSTWSSSKIASEISQRFPNLSIPSTKALKITRNSIFSAFIKVMDVHGNLFTLQCGDQDNRFYVIPSYIGTNLSVDITKFVKEATACYLYSNTYSMYVLEVIGDVSYSVIDKTTIPSTATTVTIA